MEEDIKKLQEEIESLKSEVKKLQEFNELTDVFAGKQVVKKEIQFTRKLTDANGSTIAN